jgi:CheY-like chemotaxis protein
MASILVIDDEAPLRGFLRRVLEKAGHTVWEAADGAEGLRLLQSQTPDLVFCDLFMPVQEGLETIRAVHQAQLDVPIVAMSGGGWGGQVDDFLQTARMLGAVEALEKPFSADRLLQAVETFAIKRD